MSGHSKWHTIKHKKAATDAKRGKMFTKLIRELMILAKTGGPNPDTNPQLRMSIDRAKGINMPNDNIQRAIKKGSGEEGDVNFEQISYEGYGPGGIAMYVEVLTDNKNRSAAEIRSVFSKRNGNLGGTGSVAWMFERKGLIVLNKEQVGEDELLDIVLEAGAEDMQTEEEQYEITTAPADLQNVTKALEEKKLTIENASFTLIPKTTVKAEGKDAEQILKLMDDLEECDDVQNVYANFEISDEIIKSLAE